MKPEYERARDELVRSGMSEFEANAIVRDPKLRKSFTFAHASLRAEVRELGRAIVRAFTR